jgi:hypothetical protein
MQAVNPSRTTGDHVAAMLRFYSALHDELSRHESMALGGLPR